MATSIPPAMVPRSSSLTTLGDKTMCDDADVSQKRVVAEAVDWIFKTLGMISAVVFGVWAPITYRLTQEANASNDGAQRQLLEAQRALIEEMREVRKRQSALIETLGGIAGTLYKLGEFESWKYCQREHNSTTCADTDGMNKLDILLMNINDHTRLAPSSTSKNRFPTVTSFSASSQPQISTLLAEEDLKIQVSSLVSNIITSAAMLPMSTNPAGQVLPDDSPEMRYFGSAGAYLNEDVPEISKEGTSWKDKLEEADDFLPSSMAKVDSAYLHAVLTSFAMSPGFTLMSGGNDNLIIGSAQTNMTSAFVPSDGMSYHYWKPFCVRLEADSNVAGYYTIFTLLLSLAIATGFYHGVNLIVDIVFRFLDRVDLQHTNNGPHLAKGIYFARYTLLLVLAAALGTTISLQ